ncbi:hypothetical protein WICPIJ_007551 [Wickerhamomyces pijperi]|uniref:Signal recognition particle subunit SRP72 n=1 Tax=Wickerhamomyces pijperi TaxID=599730 RepID=A0A9P8Q096_WICPI|nr:hypothetical protein WICPIJ_007551 [Wickerhamomyces pijperi]
MSSLTDLFKELSVHTVNSDHQSAFETSYEILKTSPHNLKALRLTIVSLINLEKYEQALKVFNQFKASIDSDELCLERAYVYYKLGKDLELSEIFKTFQGKEQELLVENPGLVHLKAQTLYRSGQYQEALELYQLLISSNAAGEDELSDLKVNERAVISDALTAGKFDKIGQQQQFSELENEFMSYDLIFNESLISLALGDSEKSLQLLDRAQQLSEEVNVDEEDRLSETVPIIIQKAYIRHITGDTTEAQQILEQLQHLQLSDKLTQLIFNNNWISLHDNKDTSARLSLRELQLPNSMQKLHARLSQIQQATLWRNYSKICIQIGKNIPKPSKSNTDLTIDALSQLQNNTQVQLDQQQYIIAQAKLSTKKALKTRNVALALISAQLNISASRFDAAVAVLENLETQDKFQPIVASTLLSLYEHQGSDKKKVELFDLIFGKFEDSIELTQSEFELLKLFALKLATLEPTRTQTLLHKLQHVNSSDEIVQFVLSSDQITADSLPSIASLTAHLDLAELETQAFHQITNEATKTASKTAYKVHKRPRTRKSFTVDPSKTLDAERWLPMKDRSYYKPKKSKKKGTSTATQGGSADNTTEVSTASASVVRSTGSGSGGKNKSKKKGKK